MKVDVVGVDGVPVSGDLALVSPGGFWLQGLSQDDVALLLGWLS